MGSSGNINIFLAGQKQQIYSDQGKNYVATDIAHYKTARTETIHGKETTVMPYALKITHNYGYPLWAYLHIDGIHIGRRPLEPFQTWNVNGKRTESGIQELVFAFPIEDDNNIKMPSKKVQSRCGQVGVITVDFYEAIYQGFSEFPIYQRMKETWNQPAKPTLPALTKGQAHQLTQGAYSLLSSNTGNVIRPLGKKIGTAKRASYKPGHYVDTIELMYMPSYSLQVLGVLPKPPPTPKPPRKAKKSKKTSAKTLEERAAEKADSLPTAASINMVPREKMIKPRPFPKNGSTGNTERTAPVTSEQASVHISVPENAVPTTSVETAVPTTSVPTISVQTEVPTTLVQSAETTTSVQNTEPTSSDQTAVSTTAVPKSSVSPDDQTDVEQTESITEAEENNRAIPVVDLMSESSRYATTSSGEATCTTSAGDTTSEDEKHEKKSTERPATSSKEATCTLSAGDWKVVDEVVMIPSPASSQDSSQDPVVEKKRRPKRSRWDTDESVHTPTTEATSATETTTEVISTTETEEDTTKTKVEQIKVEKDSASPVSAPAKKGRARVRAKRRLSGISPRITRRRARLIEAQVIKEEMTGSSVKKETITPKRRKSSLAKAIKNLKKERRSSVGILRARQQNAKVKEEPTLVTISSESEIVISSSDVLSASSDDNVVKSVTPIAQRVKRERRSTVRKMSSGLTSTLTKRKSSIKYGKRKAEPEPDENSTPATPKLSSMSRIPARDCPAKIEPVTPTNVPPIKKEFFTPSAGPCKVEPLTPGMITAMHKSREIYSQVLASFLQKQIKQEPADDDVNANNLDVCYPADEEGDLFFVFPHQQLAANLNDSDVVYMGDEECMVYEPPPQEVSIVELD